MLGNLTQPGSLVEIQLSSLAWILAVPQDPALKGAFGTLTFAADQVLVA